MFRNHKKRLVIIDANSVIHRAYHALPPLTTKKGELVNAVYGFLLVFLKAIREFYPDFIAACFDFPTPSFRVKIFKEYKAKRPPAPQDLYSQIPRVKEVLGAFNVAIFEKEGFEADDLIGTLSQKFSQKQVFPEAEIIILSGDLDTLQLVDKKTKVFALRKGVKDTILYDEKAVEEKYGFPPSRLVDYKALRGDPSDNIPGAAGVGEKTAKELIQDFGSIENLYQKIERDDTKKITPKLKELLLRSREQVLFSRELAKIRKDAPLDFNLQKNPWRWYNKEKVIPILKKFEFYSLIDRLPEGNIEKVPSVRTQKKNGKINKNLASPEP